MVQPKLRKLAKDERIRYGAKWVLLERWIDSVAGKRVVVPAGFICDGCSGPGIDRFGKKDWLVHDWLYATGGLTELGSIYRLSRKEADSVFKFPWTHRWLAVRVFGSAYWGSGLINRVVVDLLD